MSARRVFGGTAWTVGGYAAMQVFRFAFNVALAGLVAPRVFGVMALVNLFLLGLHMFSDLGIRQCVVRHPRGDDPAFLNTAWTMQIVRGGVLWLAAATLAWPLAALYGEPALLWLIPLAGSAEFITGFSSTALMAYSRQVRRGPLVRREVGTYMATYTGVLVAVWAIHRSWPAGQAAGLDVVVVALGLVAAAAGEAVLSHTLPAPAPHRFAWDAEARRELVRFGGWVFVSSTFTFFAAQADRLVVGKLSLELLGIYHLAVMIAALPVGVLSAVGIHLAFPLVSDAMRSGQPLGRVFRKAHRALVVLAGLLLTGVACVGPAFVGLLYDERYAGTAEFVRLLAVGAWFTALLVPGELALLALGQTRGMAVAQGARLLFVPLFLWGGYLIAGVPGLILGVAGGELVRYAVVALYLNQAGVRVFLADAALTLLAGGSLGLYLLVERAAGPQGRYAVAAAGGAVLVLLWAAVYLVWAGPETPGALLRLLPGTKSTTEAGPP